VTCRSCSATAAAAAAASGAPPPPPPRARFTDGEVLDHAITMALAGHETTAQAMCWSMYPLATEAPHWRDEARAQVLAVCGPARAPAHADLEQLPALGCIVSEAMRLYPPVPFIVRTAAADVQLPWSGGGGGGSLAVRAGTSVVVPIAGLHRDEEHWEAPHAFRPSRWARGAAAATRSGSAFAFLPFSAGSRNCIGAQFALLEVKVLLARLLQRCDWALDASYVHRPQMTITLRPAAGMPMRVWPLQQAA
jgi:cytokinin trans-hydroxylase